MRAIILANGMSDRWDGYLGVRKQEIVIDGEPLIGRTVRLLRELGVADVLISGPFDQYGAPNVIPTTETEIVDGRLSVRAWWRGRTVILLGDVYYSAEAMETIVRHKGRGHHLFARFGPSSFTGKQRAEIWANSFWPRHYQDHEASLRTVAAMKARGVIPQAGLWESYLLDHGCPIAGVPVVDWTDRAYIDVDGRTPNMGDSTEIDDWTEDFDWPGDYDDFIGRRSAR